MSKQKKPRKKAAPKRKTEEPIVKVFLVEGYYLERKNKVVFNKEIRAVQPEHAKERVYRELGSRHKLKMRSIIITRAKQIDPTSPKVEIKDPCVTYLASKDADKLVIPVR